MLALGRTGALIGVLLGTQDVLLYSHAVGLGPILKRYMFHTAPLVLMGATFAAVANGLYHHRQVDDHYNYFLAGFACGPIFAAYVGSYHAVLLGGLFFGAAAAGVKEAVLTDTNIFPIPTSHMMSLNYWRRDYTLLKDPLIEMQRTCERHSKK